MGALHESLVATRNELEDLRDEVERQKVAFSSFRGRVYAWKGHTITPEPTEEPQKALSLADPSLTKAQVKAALVASGALVPGKPFKHN